MHSFIFRLNLSFKPKLHLDPKIWFITIVDITVVLTLV